MTRPVLRSITFVCFDPRSNLTLFFAGSWRSIRFSSSICFFRSAPLRAMLVLPCPAAFVVFERAVIARPCVQLTPSWPVVIRAVTLHVVADLPDHVGKQLL